MRVPGAHWVEGAHQPSQHSIRPQTWRPDKGEAGVHTALAEVTQGKDTEQEDQDEALGHLSI